MVSKNSIEIALDGMHLLKCPQSLNFFLYNNLVIGVTIIVAMLGAVVLGTFDNEVYET